MNNIILVQKIGILYKNPGARKIYCDMRIRKTLSTGFVLGELYLERFPNAFSVKKVENSTHIYEFITETGMIKINDKLKNDCCEINEIYNFILNKDSQFFYMKESNEMKTFGLDEIENQVISHLNSDGNKLISLIGPRGCGKTTLMKKLADNLMDKCFVHFHSFKYDKKYFDTMFELLKNERKSIVLCIDEMETILKIYPMINFFILDLLKNKEIDIKILLELTDFSFIKCDELKLESIKIFLRHLNKDEKFHYVTHLIRMKTKNNDFYDEKLSNFVNKLNGFSAFDIKKFIDNVYLSHNQQLTLDNLLQCVTMKQFIPLSISRLINDNHQLYWGDIAGYDNVKTILKNEIQNPLLKGRTTSNGVLFYGPSGCSKSMFVQALATECGLTMYSITSSILRGYVGESEQMLREILNQAQASQPSIVFIDGIDCIFPSRDLSSDSPVNQRLMNELMTFLNGIETEKNRKVILIGTTQHKERLDSALIRTGRIDLHIYIGLPDDDSRQAMLRMIFADQQLLVDDDVIANIPNISQQLQGKSGAHIMNLKREIKYLILFRLAPELRYRNNPILKVTMQDVDTILNNK